MRRVSAHPALTAMADGHYRKYEKQETDSSVPVLALDRAAETKTTITRTEVTNAGLQVNPNPVP